MRRVEKIRGRLGRASHRAAAPGQGLRQGGVYSLPDGTELVAAAAPGGRHLLYHQRVWVGHARVVEKPVAYVVTAALRTGSYSGRLCDPFLRRLTFAATPATPAPNRIRYQR